MRSINPVLLLLWLVMIDHDHSSQLLSDDDHCDVVDDDDDLNYFDYQW